MFCSDEKLFDKSLQKEKHHFYLHYFLLSKIRRAVNMYACYFSEHNRYWLNIQKQKSLSSTTVLPHSFPFFYCTDFFSSSVVLFMCTPSIMYKYHLFHSLNPTILLIFIHFTHFSSKNMVHSIQKVWCMHKSVCNMIRKRKSTSPLTTSAIKKRNIFLHICTIIYMFTLVPTTWR